MASVNFLHLQMEQGKNLIKKGFVWRTNYSKYAQQKTFSSYYDDYFHFYTICEKSFLYIKFSGIVWKKLYLLSIKASADWAFILLFITLYIKRKLHREESFQNQLFCVITGGTTLEPRKPIPRENPTMPYSMLTQKMCIFLPMTLIIIILYDLLKNKSLISQYFHWVSFGTAAILSGIFTGKLKS